MTGGDPARMAEVLTGIRAYQRSSHVRAADAASVAAQQGSSRLMLHARSGRPVVIVPSLINGPEVVDLAPGASLVERLAARGFAPLVVNWGAPAPAERAFSIDDLVTERLLPLLAAIGEPAPLIGYCLGGTIAAAAAQLAPPPALALVAAPWTFTNYGAERRNALLALWEQIGPGAEASGLVPVDLLQPGFWDLDPGRAVEKFARFGRMDPSARESRQYVLVEDWVNGGPPISFAAAAQIFERFYGEDEPGTGRWRIEAVAIDPSTLTCPILNVVSTTDRIVPTAAAAAAGARIGIASGHVGMMVGSRARELLYDPLADWLGAD